MNVDCFYCLRYLLMFIIFLNMFLGLTLLGASLWTFLHGDRMGQVFADTEGFNYVLYFLMALGAAKFLLGFLGCSSVAKKNSRMLATFFSLMLVVFLCQVGAGIWLYVDEDQVTERAEGSLYEFIRTDYKVTGFEAKTKSLDVIQSKFECCGSQSPSDWSSSVYNGAGNGTNLYSYKLPHSCCKSNDTVICDISREIQGNIVKGSVYDEGCINKILAQIKDYSWQIFGVIGGIVLIELFVMSSTLILCRSKNVRYQI